MVGFFQKKNVQLQTETGFHLSQVAGQESLKRWAWRVPHIQSIWSRWESPPSSSWILEPSNINWIWILSCSQCNQCSQASVEDHEGEDCEQKYRESIFCTSSCCTRKVTPSVADDWSQASEQDKHQVPQRKPSFISKHNEMEKKNGELLILQNEQTTENAIFCHISRCSRFTLFVGCPRCDSTFLPTPVITKINEEPMKGPMMSIGRSPAVLDQNHAEMEYIPQQRQKWWWFNWSIETCSIIICIRNIYIRKYTYTPRDETKRPRRRKHDNKFNRRVCI